jgi:hypothetical protein
MVSPEVTRTSRTPGIATVAELAAQIKEVRDAAAAATGAAVPLTIQVHTPQAGFMQRPGSAEKHRDHLGQLATPEWTRSSCGRRATASTKRSSRCATTRKPS